MALLVVSEPSPIVRRRPTATVSSFRGAVLFVRPASAPAPQVDPIDSLPLYQLLRDAVTRGQAAGTIRADDADTMTPVPWPLSTERWHCRCTSTAST